MKLSGTIKCPKADCGRTVPFQIRTHDASKVEFKTTCKRCDTRIDLTFFVAEEVIETPFEMIEGAQPTTFENCKFEETQEKEEVKESATSQLPTTPEAESRQPDEDKNEPSGDEQAPPSDHDKPEETSKPDKEDPFAGLE